MNILLYSTSLAISHHSPLKPIEICSPTPSRPPLLSPSVLVYPRIGDFRPHLRLHPAIVTHPIPLELACLSSSTHRQYQSSNIYFYTKAQQGTLRHRLLTRVVEICCEVRHFIVRNIITYLVYKICFLELYLI